MLALIARAADPGDEEEVAPGEAGALFGAAEVTGVDVAAIRDEPGNVSVKTIGQETFKLGAIRAVGLPGDLFAGVAPKVLAGWRARVAAEAPSAPSSWPAGSATAICSARPSPAERGGELQRRQRLHPLRQARRARLQPS